MSTRSKIVRMLMVVSLCLNAACGANKEETKPPRPRPVKYTTIESDALQNASSFAGSVVSRSAAEVGFRVAGVILKLSVKTGDSVKKGQVIASIDGAEYKIQLAQAQADYQTRKTSLDYAKSQFARAERLFESGTSSQSDYDKANGDVKNAQAQLNAVGQQVKLAKTNLGYTSLKAPFDGVVNSVPAKSGEQIAVGKAVAVISRGGELEILVGLPENFISKVSVGTPSSIVVDSYSKSTLKGAVRTVAVASENSTYAVKVTLTKSPKELRSGMAAEVIFGLDKTSIKELTVPAAAVGNDGQSSFVYVVTEETNGSFVIRKQKVNLGPLNGNDFPILKGLKTDDKVAVAGLASLVDGLKVRLLKAPGELK